MLHSIASIVTTSAIVLHALLGCCLHHSHMTTAISSSVEKAASHLHSCQCDHPNSGDSPDQEDQQNDNHDNQCDEPDCSFVSTERVNDISLVVRDSLWLTATVEGNVLLHDRLRRGPLICDYDSGHLIEPGLMQARSQVWRL